MKYVCMDDGAVSEFISGKEYQSIDFEEGDKLIKALSGKVQFLARFRKVVLVQDNEGAFLTTAGPWKRKKFLVIDCEQSALFTDLRSSESLQSFQKLLRFCAKYWTNSILNRSERIITGTSKAVIFPLPYSAKPYRIAIEREPMNDRLKRRDMAGHFLLVYKSGWDGADSGTEQADEANFKRVYERLQDIYSTAAKAMADTDSILEKTKLASTYLEGEPSSSRPMQMPFRDWMKQLTRPQREFIQSDFSTPHRLQGPAGTGKTLSLMLRTIGVLKRAEKEQKTCHALIVTHSEATRKSIQNALSVIDETGFQNRDRKIESVALDVVTLASLCAEVLQQSISDSEFIDRDAQDSKILQNLYIEQAISRVKTEDFNSFKPHLSEAFKNMFQDTSVEVMAPLFQHEISVLVKGRAGDSFDVYKNCPSLKYGLPISNEADKGLAFRVFTRYQEQLEVSSQFDTDDVVISAIGQLDTPIWRRRRLREGFDFMAIDETHLFNMNELHVFHHFTRDSGSLPISFTVDRAQAVGDRGWNDLAASKEIFGVGGDLEETQTLVTAVFRSSPAIRDFCQSVLASGATLFTNFDDTMRSSQSVFTVEDERKSQPVRYKEYVDDPTMIAEAFRVAEEIRANTQSNRSNVLITTLDDSILVNLRDYAAQNNKPMSYLDRRGDYSKVEQAEKSGHMVLGHADFVGGLEFEVVVVVGVDRGRVPKNGDAEDSNSRNYSSYSAHNRLYVASSRARYGLAMLGVKSRGPSELLRSAVSSGLIDGVVF